MLVDQNSNSPGPYAGYLRRYTYQVNGQTRTCTGTTNYATGGNLEFSGDGFVQNHTATGGDSSSGNGAGFPGTTTVTLQGSSHAIITFSMPGYKIGGQTIPTTVQWFFADGRSHPVFSVSQDARATSGNLGADSRTPYGDMAYDGDGIDALVGGFSYGDTYKFVTLASNPEEVTQCVGLAAPPKPTRFPYTMQWAEPATVDAEMGHVATLPIRFSDQGGRHPNQPFRQSPRTFSTLAPKMFPCQMVRCPPPTLMPIRSSTTAYPPVGQPTASASRGVANFGRVGGFDNYGDTSVNVTQYSQHSTDPINQPLSGTRADGLLMAYSTFIVLGTHTGGYENGTVGQAVKQMENAAAANLTATTGTVVTSGPAGVGTAGNATITYTPSGYDPTFAAWELAAASNAVNTTLTPGAGEPLDHPLFVVDGYSASQSPASISINGKNVAGTDYYATLDASAQRLWITVNQTATSAIHLVITAPAPVPLITSTAAASGNVGTTFSYQITAANTPTSYGVQGLPGGLTVNSSTGLISGTPKVAGTYALTLNAYNSAGKGSATLTLTITQSTPVITSATTAGCTVGATFSYQIAASGSPTSFGVQGLPGGLSVNSSTGLVSGTPKIAGKFTLTLNAYNNAGKGSAALTLTIAQSAPVITSAETATGKVGATFFYQITASGSPVSYGVQGLPGGLSINSSAGTITGMPKQSGTFSLTLNAYNSTGKGSASLTLTIDP